MSRSVAVAMLASNMATQLLFFWPYSCTNELTIPVGSRYGTIHGSGTAEYHHGYSTQALSSHDMLSQPVDGAVYIGNTKWIC